jgi:hypothetical protein
MVPGWDWRSRRGRGEREEKEEWWDEVPVICSLTVLEVVFPAMTTADLGPLGVEEFWTSVVSWLSSLAREDEVVSAALEWSSTNLSSCLKQKREMRSQQSIESTAGELSQTSRHVTVEESRRDENMLHKSSKVRKICRQIFPLSTSGWLKRRVEFGFEREIRLETQVMVCSRALSAARERREWGEEWGEEDRGGHRRIDSKSFKEVKQVNISLPMPQCWRR